MLSLLEDLPVELVGTKVLSFLSLKNIVKLERACDSTGNKYHQLFLDLIPYCPPVKLPSWKQSNKSVLQWFAKRKCRISSLTIRLPGDNPGLDVKNLQVEYIELEMLLNTSSESLKPIFENNKVCKIRSLYLLGNQNRKVMKKLIACTKNVKKLRIYYSDNFMDWLTVDILQNWKLDSINLSGPTTTRMNSLTLIVQTCTELTSIKLDSNSIDDSTVIAIAQHCSKLQTLVIESSKITYISLIVLSERNLPLKELNIDYIPNIPTADIARRCSHALSCIRHVHTYHLDRNGQYATILLPYLTGLTSVHLNYHANIYIPLLTQHCHKLTKVNINICNVTDIMSLCRANPLLQELALYYAARITDTALIELIHACPHLHKLYLPKETDITDIGILALSEHCQQLKQLVLSKCNKVTETAVLQLLQRCRKLTRLDLSRSSLSEETWTQLDSNTQKRVNRW